MGNRAVLSIGTYTPETIGIYVHWNGGRDSIEGFLTAAKQRLQGRLGDEQYGTARLIQCIAAFFEGNLSVGVGPCKELDCDNHNNGVYEIDPATMQIVGRHHFKTEEQRHHDPEEIARIILKRLGVAEAIEE